MSKKKYSGKVIKRTYAESSKSQHEAVMLDTGKKEYKLRRVGGTPFVDKVLNSLVGSEVECVGIERGQTLIIKDWEQKEDKPKKSAKKKSSKKKKAVKKKKAAKKKTVAKKAKTKSSSKKKPARAKAKKAKSTSKKKSSRR